MANRLTEAQRRVLERLATGDEVWTTGGVNTHAFWHNAMRDRAPSLATLSAMWRASLIENREPAKFSGSKYRITTAGRAALEKRDE